jgi:hypothetical protein
VQKYGPKDVEAGKAANKAAADVKRIMAETEKK